MLCQKVLEIFSAKRQWDKSKEPGARLQGESDLVC